MKSILLLIYVLSFSWAFTFDLKQIDLENRTVLGKGTENDFFIKHHPLDPVNVKNLNFYLTATDVEFPCYGFDLVIERVYNSSDFVEWPFGIGWSLNLVSYIVETDQDIVLIEGDGFKSYFDKEEYHDINKLRIIDELIVFKKQEDKTTYGKIQSNDKYESMKKKLNSDDGYYRSTKRRFLADKLKIEPGNYISTTRGKSFLAKLKKGGFIRDTISGIKEYYDAKGYLVKKSDRNGNVISYIYNNEKLDSITDPCGRIVKFSYNGDQIETLTDPLGEKITYRYDKKKRLREVLKGKSVTKYHYSAFNQLVKIEFSKDNIMENFYDKLGFCVKQVGPGKKVSKYERKTDPYNKFHTTVQYTSNEGESTKYEFFRDEDKSVVTEKDGKKRITTLTKCCGKPASVVNEKGEGVFMEYDAADNLISRKDSFGNSAYFTYESKFNQLSTITDNLNNKMNFKYDERGNLINVKSSGGEEILLSFNKRGKMTGIEKKNEVKVLFKYNNYGKPTEITQEKLGTTFLSYDKQCNVSNVYAKGVAGITLPEEEIKAQIKKTLSYLLQYLQPAGLSMGY